MIIVTVKEEGRETGGLKVKRREIVDGVYLGCRITSQDQNICAKWMPAIRIMLAECRNPHV